MIEIKKMRAPKDMQIGCVFTTKKHGSVTVIEYYNTHTVIVAFNNAGNTRSICAPKLRTGQLIDRAIPAQSVMVGKQYKSTKHGVLTVIEINAQDIVLLQANNGDEIRIMLSAMRKLKEYVDNNDEDINALIAAKSKVEVSDIIQKY